MTPADIGGTVRQRRINLQLHQAELADIAEVSERFIRDLEKGKSTVRLDKLTAVLSVLGLELHVVNHNPLRQHSGGVA